MRPTIGRRLLNTYSYSQTHIQSNSHSTTRLSSLSRIQLLPTCLSSLKGHTNITSYKHYHTLKSSSTTNNQAKTSVVSSPPSLSSSLSFSSFSAIGILSASIAAVAAYIYLTVDSGVDCSTGVTTKKWHYYKGPSDSKELADLRLISGSSHPALAAEIAGYLGIPLSSATVGSFTDGEIAIAVNDNVRECHVFVIAPVTKPVNDTLVELLLLIATLRRASAAEITAVIPYFGYCRQDRKMQSRVPISAADVALMLDEMGVDRVISVDLHTGQIQGFFPPKIPVEDLQSVIIGALYFAEKSLTRPVVVAPSSGSVIRAKKFREVLQEKNILQTEVDLAMLIEHQYHEMDEGGRLIGVARELDLVGEVAGHDCIIVEDIVDTANTLNRAAQELKKQGALNVYAFASHGLFSEGALEKIRLSPISELVITNTIPFPSNGDELSGNKTTQLTLAPLLAESIKRVYKNQTILHLFDVDGGNAEQEHNNNSSNNNGGDDSHIKDHRKKQPTTPI